MRGLYLMFALLSVRAIAQNAEPAGPVRPQLIETIDPEYSDEARIAGLEGTVHLLGAIAEDGRLPSLHKKPASWDIRNQGRLGCLHGFDRSASCARPGQSLVRAGVS